GCFFPSRLIPQQWHMRESFEFLARNRGYTNVAVRLPRPRRPRPDEGYLVPGFRQLAGDSHESDLRPAVDAVQSGKGEQYSHLIGATAAVHCGLGALMVRPVTRLRPEGEC